MSFPGPQAVGPLLDKGAEGPSPQPLHAEGLGDIGSMSAQVIPPLLMLSGAASTYSCIRDHIRGRPAASPPFAHSPDLCYSPLRLDAPTAHACPIALSL